MSLTNEIATMAIRGAAVLKNHSPAILTVVGVATGIAACVTACKSSTKARQVKEILDDEMAVIDEAFEKFSNGETSIEYTSEDKKNDIHIAYTHAVVGYIKAYGPTVLLEGISIACHLLSHGIMRKRNAGLTAACAAITDMFNRYRQNVRERFGDEVDEELRYDLKSQKIKVEEIDPETGKKRTVTKNVKVPKSDVPWHSKYAKLYQEGCHGWTKDANQNLLVLRAQQAYANQLLRNKGHLFLNEVYKLLGIDETEAGSEVGWIYEENNPIGNNYIDFHIDDSPDFVAGFERNVWLDFNVDGAIRNRIRWAKY